MNCNWKMHTMEEAIPYLYRSLLKAKPFHKEENDAMTRAPYLTKALLAKLSLLPSKEKIILVTGSKGKGSTSRMIASILSGLGLKVGLFTSPHLVHLNERIRVNGKAIRDEQFLTYLNRHYEEIEHITAKIQNPMHYFGPTGILLSVALAHFQEKDTAINVIEIGRGGTYDDTNVLDNNWAVISKVMGEHVGFLGHSISDTVSHKVGIIKEMTEKVFVGKQTEEAAALIKGKLRSHPEVYYYGEDFAPFLQNMTIRGSSFKVKSRLLAYNNLILPLLGSYQLENAALAIQACESIIGAPLSESMLQECLKTIKWPGRLEMVEEHPTVILDGSINRVSAVYLKEVLPLIDKRKVICIIGVPDNKDYEGVIQVCSEFAHHLILTTPDDSHKKFPKDALHVARKYHHDAFEVDFLSAAVKKAKLFNPSAIFIVGTQSLIGSAKVIWQDSLMEI